MNRATFRAAAGEKFNNKARAFAIFSKLEYENPFTNNQFRLQELLKDIRSTAENYDQGSIALFSEGLIYYEDVTKI